MGSTGHVAAASLPSAGLRRLVGWLAVLALAGSEALVLAMHHASPKAYSLVIAFVLAAAVAVAFPVLLGPAGWLGIAISLGVAAVALLFTAWGFPLNASQTERAVAKAHPNLRQPIRCRPGHQELGTVFEKVYVCVFQGGDPGGLPVAVNDSRIVREWP